MGETNALLQRSNVRPNHFYMSFENLMAVFYFVLEKETSSSKICLLPHSKFSSKLNQILKRDTVLATAAIYESMFGAEDGTIPATFQVILNSLALQMFI